MSARKAKAHGTARGSASSIQLNDWPPAAGLRRIQKNRSKVNQNIEKGSGLASTLDVFGVGGHEQIVSRVEAAFATGQGQDCDRSRHLAMVSSCSGVKCLFGRIRSLRANTLSYLIPWLETINSDRDHKTCFRFTLLFGKMPMDTNLCKCTLCAGSAAGTMRKKLSQLGPKETPRTQKHFARVVFHSQHGMAPGAGKVRHPLPACMCSVGSCVRQKCAIPFARMSVLLKAGEWKECRKLMNGTTNKNKSKQIRHHTSSCGHKSNTRRNAIRQHHGEAFLASFLISSADRVLDIARVPHPKMAA